MTDINKLIEEEAREYAFQQYKNDEFTETILFNETINDFKAGANFILHQNRWRKVEEELPKIDTVLIKCIIHLPNNKKYIEYSTGIIYSKTKFTLHNKLAESLMLPNCKVEIEWKPIE